MTVVVRASDIRERIIAGYHGAPVIDPEVIPHDAPRNLAKRSQPSHPSQGVFGSRRYPRNLLQQCHLVPHP